MQGLFKRNNSKYWWISYVDLSGKTIRESSKSTKYKDAEDMLIKKKNMLREGHYPLSKGINKTFKELAGKYLDFCKNQKDFRSKEIIIKQLIRKFGNLPLKSFNLMILEQYQTECLCNGNKPATVNKKIAYFKNLFTKADNWSMIPPETLRQIRKIKMLKTENSRLRYLSDEEREQLINACDPHLKPIVIAALNTGLRKSELLSLTWGKVDLKAKIILVENTKSGNRRSVPINDTLLTTLQKMPRSLKTPYVFYNPDTNTKFTDIKHSFGSACRRAGIKDFRWHDLRHDFASRLAVSNVSIMTISKLLGHASINMSMRYAHLAPEHLANAVSILDSRKKSTAHLLHIFDTSKP